MEDYLRETIRYYSSSAREYEIKVAGLHHKIEGEFFMKEIPINGRILDAGCGDGRDCKIFSERGFEVTGIDLTPEFLEIARKKVPNGNFLNMDLRSLVFRDNYFNGIWSCASIVHINRDGVYQFLTEAKRVLKDKGILYLAAKEGNLGQNSRKSFFFYNKEDIEKLIRDTGFDVIYVTGGNEIKVGEKIHLEVRAFARK
jgi:ubiquinone/menaquinone biosynthesis C-methylase UbiE